MTDAHRYRWREFQPADVQGIKVRPVRKSPGAVRVLLLMALPAWVVLRVAIALVAGR